MIIKREKNSKWEPCPEYMGIAKIIDMTPLKEVETKFGTREVFRFLLEIDQQREDGGYWVVSTRPFTPSLHERAALRQFVDRVAGPLTEAQLDEGFDIESLVGQYVHVAVEHAKSEDGQTTYANITYISKPKEKYDEWQSEYERLKDREASLEAQVAEFEDLFIEEKEEKKEKKAPAKARK